MAPEPDEDESRTHAPKSIHAATRHERALAEKWRATALRVMDHDDTTDERLCERLGLAQSGLDRLRAQPSWTLILAYRVLDCMGIEPQSGSTDNG